MEKMTLCVSTKEIYSVQRRREADRVAGVGLYFLSQWTENMTWTRELFTSLSEMDPDLHVELGTNAKCGVEAVGIVRFQLEPGGSLEVENVMNLLSVLAMEDSGCTISFQDGRVLIQPKGSNIDSTRFLGVREGKVYWLQGKPVGGSKGILDHGSMSVTKDEEQEALKGEQSSQTSSVRRQPSAGKRELAPSNSVRRLSWYELTLMDVQEREEDPRSTDMESRPPKKCPYFRALMCSVIDSETSSVQGAAAQQGWRDSSVQDDVCNIVPGLEEEPVPGGSSRSTFLAKREC
jgi:hypothetical protein